MEKLYYNGDIITMRKENDAPEAVLVSRGRIAFVGDLKEAKQRCTAETELVDLQGKTLMPSFIDAHGHIIFSSWKKRFWHIRKKRISRTAL